ncbi:7,8-didemethyl-8-hydroxy-5-deazariboflavin synthase [Modestobacter sp. I12A-02628]|uniref:FO synthase n=1 Tax=Goekera deserti TaxID=2497753 RepID=A0A7K3WBE7_9ACTN|nr:bifunctional FO biosynthesis protein CofGH [Goekera deserti]MPQ98224.1 7,8-didemethyl-8-hydroxy-5-deazariboflavin synthase [Goekera deserti]NDI48050.1 bifunctional FO biosynthesis protein CofGH [Goekera deserti]NEL53798.1 bifunctional FO biosynthesis protein CofGH [Goekera deserti]
MRVPSHDVPAASAISRALTRAERGVSLDATECETLLHARGLDAGEPLDRLLTAASRVRDAGLASAGRPGVVTYSRKVFIPLTHLCRDRCHYCTFVTTPGQLRAQGKAPFLSPDEVLDVARAGAAMGCKEALFTLGDRPEDRWPVAAQWLEAHGYDSTLGYLRAMAIRVLEETGLLPHLNPGVLTWEEIQRLKPVSASMGMMLETTATRLWSSPGGPHFGSPDKEPAVRLRVLEDAGRSAVPFTTGVLLGIGESYAERVDAIAEIRASARRHGHVQEVIVQNFRAKPRTAMAAADDLELQEYVAAVAVTRLMLGPKARVQAPPNLSDSTELGLLVRAGVDDWGGVSPLTPDHVNPERPWPSLVELAALTEDAGFTLRERLAAQPPYVQQPEPWLDPRVRPHVRALAGPDGLAVEGRVPVGLPWQEPDEAWTSSGRVDLHVEVDTVGRSAETRSDFDAVYGDWSELRDRTVSARDGHSTALTVGDPAVHAALSHAERDPAGLTDAEYLTLLGADGPDLDSLAALADAVRRDVTGDDVTYVVNRNINFTNVCYTGCRFCAFAQRRTDADAYTLSMAQVGDRVDEAWAGGATEICMQGGIHPDLPGTAYFDLAREVKRRRPEIHLHAFSPMEVVNGAARTGLSFTDFLTAAREAGLDSIPGTAAEILDDDVRWVLTKGKLPTATWLEVIRTAHTLGIPSTSTMMYGHVDTPAHWVGHLRTLSRLQDETGGFREFVLLPFVHHSSPIYLAGVARPGPTNRENRAVHAVARLLLHGRIDNIQTSWVKLGDAGTRTVLQGGANDLGGTLMEETISRMAGSENGSLKTIAELEGMAAAIARPARQRTTDYGTPSAERLATARSDAGRRALTLSITPA